MIRSPHIALLSLLAAGLASCGGEAPPPRVGGRELNGLYRSPCFERGRGERQLGCLSCHRLHGGSRDDQLDPKVTTDDRCGSCHQDVAGPWIHEHTPVAEDCSSCHAPHGSSSDGLVEPSQLGVCIQCHSVALSGAVHDPWAFTSRCTECHSAVHGSFADPYLRR